MRVFSSPIYSLFFSIVFAYNCTFNIAFSSYRDADIYDINDSDSEYDSDDGPDLMEPSSRSPSPYKGSVKPSS